MVSKIYSIRCKQPLSATPFLHSVTSIKSKFFFIAILLCLFSDMLIAQTRTDSLMQEVNRAISSSSVFDQIKNKRIDSIKLVLYKSGDIPHRTLFNLYSALYNEYQVYNYDSAFSYAQKMVSEGQSLHEDSLVGYAKIKEGFVLLSAGLFKETFDLLQNVNMSLLSKTEKAEYFTMMARYYYDVADYDNDRVLCAPI